MKKICVQCGKEFELSEAEIDFYREKELEIPKRCHSCRQSNRIRKYDAVVPKGIGKKGKNYFGIGRAMPGLLMIFVLFIAFTFGRSILNGGGDSGGSGGGGSRVTVTQSAVTKPLAFRSFKQLNQHYEKHGKSMGFASAEEYLAAANEAIANPDALHKKEKEDGDDVYYVKQTNDFVIVSTDGYIRTYFWPEEGIAYYNRQ